jgi:hypothetical protein
VSFLSKARKADHDKAYGKGFIEYFESKLKELTERDEDIHKRISVMRKSGKDMFFAEVAAKKIKPKILYFKASKSYEDYKRAALVIREAYIEIDKIEPIKQNKK